MALLIAWLKLSLVRDMARDSRGALLAICWAVVSALALFGCRNLDQGEMPSPPVTTKHTAVQRLVDCTNAFLVAVKDRLDDCSFRVIVAGREVLYDISRFASRPSARAYHLTDDDFRKMVQTEDPSVLIALAELARLISPAVHFRYFSERLICPSAALPYVYQKEYSLRALTAGISSGACNGPAFMEAWNFAAIQAMSEARGSSCEYLLVKSREVAFYASQVVGDSYFQSKLEARFIPPLQREFFRNVFASRECDGVQEEALLASLPHRWRETYRRFAWGESGSQNAIGLEDSAGRSLGTEAMSLDRIDQLSAYCDQLYPGWNARSVGASSIAPDKLAPGCYRVAELGTREVEITLPRDPFASFGVILFASGAPIFIRSEGASATVLVNSLTWTGGSLPVPVTSFPVVFGVADSRKLPSEYLAFHFVKKKDAKELTKKFLASPIRGNVDSVVLVTDRITQQRVLNVLEQDLSELDPALVAAAIGASPSGANAVPLRFLNSPSAVCSRLIELRNRHKEIVVPPEWDGMMSADDRNDRLAYCGSLSDSECLQKIIAALSCDSTQSLNASKLKKDRQLNEWKVNGAAAAIE